MKWQILLWIFRVGCFYPGMAYWIRWLLLFCHPDASLIHQLICISALIVLLINLQALIEPPKINLDPHTIPQTRPEEKLMEALKHTRKLNSMLKECLYLKRPTKECDISEWARKKKQQEKARRDRKLINEAQSIKHYQ